MKPSEVEATWNADSKTLAIKFFRDTLELKSVDFCDTTYTKKGDVMTLRLTPSMTRLNFDGWTKAKDEGSFAAIAGYIEHCEQLMLAD